ncbi:MAG TPA: translation initiation factor IF-2, partial [Planctomycetota bacterium]|nr:translation initiation factor IF-2 [Planctomycetota bacterium]
ELMDLLESQGRPVKSHMSTIDPLVASIFRDRYKPKTPPPPPPEATRGAPGAAAARKASPDAPRAPAGVGAGARKEPGRAREETTEGGGDAVAARSRESGGVKTWDKNKGPRRVRYFPESDFRQETRTSGARRRPQRGRPAPSSQGGRTAAPTAAEKLPDRVDVFHPVTVKDLSSALGIKSQVLVKKLLEKGRMVTINQYLDEETILELSVDLGVEINLRRKEAELEEAVRALDQFESAPDELVTRAPVVTFMGHVDHGKTSLLDRIRSASVTSREAGGITQHLGAYRVDRGNVHVTFIDTPGHEAFTEMRARGANVTDVAVLVVAADDGPKPQTEEAINHVRAAGVRLIVALNKIDLPAANPQRCKEALANLGLLPVEWNGDTEFVEVSAKTGQGIDTLLETLSLESEILELKANPKRPALGTVLEVEATSQRGTLVTVLVQDGTLRVGDYVLCGASHGRVRSLILNGVEQIQKAGPSYPVQIVGLTGVPSVGDKFYVFADEKKARQLASERADRLREAERAERQQVTLENLFDHLAAESLVKELRIIIKADVRGSIDALKNALEQIQHEEVRLVILHTGVGAISQEDINLALASQAVVIGFHVVADDRARALADENGVDVRYYDVIYQVVDDVQSALEAKLSPEIAEEIHGRAEIRQVYKASRIGNIAGCYVTSGFVRRSDKIRVIRDGRVIHTGELASLKRFKDDVREVKENYECGMKVANYDNIQVGDILEAFTTVERQRKL